MATAWGLFCMLYYKDRMSSRQTRWVVVALLGAALFSRLLGLDLRPLHHDEGVNYWFAAQIAPTGQYRYDPTNYHGPTMFYAIFLSFLFGGISAVSLRLPAALLGIALVSLPLVAGRWDRRWGLLAAGGLLLSPSVTYFSRYAIHEVAVLVLSLLSVLLLVALVETGQPRWLPPLAITLALLLTTKETAIFMLAVLVVAAWVHRRRLQAVGWQANFWPALLWAVVGFGVTYAVAYTNFFTYPQGLFDSPRGLAPWVARGVQGGGHRQPGWFYLELLVRYELPVVVFGLLGLWRARRSVLGRCLAVWFIGVALAYSLIPYKTPWLLVNLTVPLVTLAAFGYLGLPGRRVKAAALLASGLFLGVMTLTFNFLMPWQFGNPYAYEHTSADVLSLVSRVKGLRQGQPRVLIIADDYWPLPFYFHGLSVEYLRAMDAPDPAVMSRYDVLVVQDSAFYRLRLPPRAQVQSYQLRPSVRLYYVQPPPSSTGVLPLIFLPPSATLGS